MDLYSNSPWIYWSSDINNFMRSSYVQIDIAQIPKRPHETAFFKPQGKMQYHQYGKTYLSISEKSQD